MATWDEVDLEAASWTVPAERMKAEQARRVPLAPRCLKILDEAGRTDAGQYVFPSWKADQQLSNMVFHMILRRMKRTDFTLHGFRSSFRVWSAGCTNYSCEVCEADLAHTLMDRVETVYRRTDLFGRRRRLMED